MKLDFIQIGRIVNAHGIRGEVRLLPQGFDPAYLTGFKTFYLGKDKTPVVPTTNHVHKSFVLLKLPGVDDMNAALAYKERPVFIRREDAEDGEPFDDELLGMDVKNADTGELLGKLTLIEDYPASKVYTVTGTHTYLIPAVPEVFIKSVDLDANEMLVHILKGMETDAN
ncbi:ribosome maturation factor RimM [Oscillibacter sp. GMB15532]|uniref:ribosome maturation factor RimM n=1 Tax=Oscillibacter sp. GMB15532 TaxID=3230022 RepID=UPI0034E027FB